MKITRPVIELNIIRIHTCYDEITISCVVAIRLVVLGIPQPPRAAVRRMPRALLTHSTLHCIIGATTTTVPSASYVHNQMRFSRIVRDVLAQSVEHEGPVVLVTRGPKLPPTRTRIF